MERLVIAVRSTKEEDTVYKNVKGEEIDILKMSDQELQEYLLECENRFVTLRQKINWMMRKEDIFECKALQLVKEAKSRDLKFKTLSESEAKKYELLKNTYKLAKV